MLLVKAAIKRVKNLANIAHLRRNFTESTEYFCYAVNVENKTDPKSRGYGKALIAILFATATVTIHTPPALAQSRGEAVGYQSAQVKAAFLYRLPRFIRWQDGRQATHFCFDQKSDVMETFKLLAEAKSDAMSVSVVQKGDESTTCDVLFVVNDEIASLAPNQLLVSDRKDFATQGGMVELTRKGARLGLNINLDSLKTGNLSASSQLLKLANVVGGG